MVRRVAELAQENERLIARLRAAGIDPASPVPPSRPAGEREPGRDDYGRLLLDSMSEGFYVVDQAGLTTVCNAAMLRLLGFTRPQEVIGRSLHELVHHSHADGSPYPVAACPIYRAARLGSSARVTGEVFFRSDGTQFPVEYRVEPVIRDGEILGAICTFVDITERLATQRQIEESEQRLALAMTAGRIGIWDYAPQTGVLRWDDRVRALFGLAPGKPITIEGNLAAIHPADLSDTRAAMAGAFDPGGTGEYHVRFRAIGIDDGKERWLEAQGLTSFRDGKPHRFLGVCRDISEEKQSELHLRLMVNELNHRVKNSLAMVQAIAAQTLRRTSDIEASRDAFNERLVALARAHDVLTAARWEAADLGEVVQGSLRSLVDHRASCVAAAGPAVSLSPKAVLAFSMALHELATNATKYGSLASEAGSVSIRWSAPGVGAGRRLVFIWEESGGPPVKPPDHRGFGSKLIERGLASELQGTVRIEFPVTGVICTIDAPYPAVVQRTLLP